MSIRPRKQDLGSLKDAAASSPAAGAVARSSLLEVAAERHARLTKLLESAARATAPDAELVHDVRVAARRLSEAAALLATIMDKPTARMVDETLKAFRRAAGELRDLDVTSYHLARSRGKWAMPAPLRKLARGMVADLQARRPALEQHLREAATSISITGAMIMLARTLEEHAPADDGLKGALQKRIALREKQLLRRFGSAAKKQTPEALHEARIAAKKLRYVLEVEDDANLRKRKRELRVLKRIQQLLGDHHDVHVLLQKLADEVKAKSREIKGLSVVFRRWQREKLREQSCRAGIFFQQSYLWRNG